MKQQALTGFEKYGKTTRRAKFLADMDRIIPWPEMTAAVATVYPKISDQGGRPPIPLERMLRIASSRKPTVCSGPSTGFFEAIQRANAS